MSTVKTNRAVWEHSSWILSRIQTSYHQVLGTLAQRELHELFDSFRFRAAGGLIVLLMVISAFLYASRYETERSIYQELLAGYHVQLEHATIKEMAELPHPFAKPPWKLAFLVDGQQQDVPNVYRQPLSTWQEPRLERARPSGDRLPAAEPLDWAFLIRVVLSLAAFILSYDSICGSRQRATLKIILSYAIERWQVLAAKIIALWISISAPFLVGAFTSLLILQLVGNLRLGWTDLAKVGEITLLGLWAIAFFVCVGIFVSLLSHESSRSLALLAMIWITMVIVIPAASGLLAHQIRPVPTRQEIDQVSLAIEQGVEQKYAGPGSWRPLETAAADGFVAERKAAKIQTERFRQQERYRRKVLMEQFDQIRVARNLAAISPMQLTQDIAERLVGSGALRDQLFIHRAWEHSERLFAYVEKMDRQDPASPGLFFFPDYMSNTKPSHTPPDFKFEEISIAYGFSAAWERILLFGLVTFIFSTATLLLFSSFQVG